MAYTAVAKNSTSTPTTRISLDVENTTPRPDLTESYSTAGSGDLISEEASVTDEVSARYTGPEFACAEGDLAEIFGVTPEATGLDLADPGRAVWPDRPEVTAEQSNGLAPTPHVPESSESPCPPAPEAQFSEANDNFFLHIQNSPPSLRKNVLDTTERTPLVRRLEQQAKRFKTSMQKLHPSDQVLCNHPAVSRTGSSGTLQIGELSATFTTFEGFRTSLKKQLRLRDDGDGNGTSGTVLRKYHKSQPGKLYAVKRFAHQAACGERTRRHLRAVANEYTIAQSLSHPSIVRTYALLASPARFYILMEDCAHGDLHDVLTTRPVGLDERLCLFKQMMRGVAYLHRRGVAHMDLKLENLLVDAAGRLKICDFGVARVFRGEHPGTKRAGGRLGVGLGVGIARQLQPELVGTLEYIAPEVYAVNKPYDPAAADVWSAGIVLFFLCQRTQPFSCASAERCDRFEHYAKTWSDFSSSCCVHASGPTRMCPLIADCGQLFQNAPLVESGMEVLLRMLCPDPSCRIGVGELVQGSWFQGVDCCVSLLREGELDEKREKMVNWTTVHKKRRPRKKTTKESFGFFRARPDSNCEETWAEDIAGGEEVRVGVVDVVDAGCSTEAAEDAERQCRKEHVHLPAKCRENFSLTALFNLGF